MAKGRPKTKLKSYKLDLSQIKDPAAKAAISFILRFFGPINSSDWYIPEKTWLRLPEAEQQYYILDEKI